MTFRPNTTAKTRCGYSVEILAVLPEDDRLGYAIVGLLIDKYSGEREVTMWRRDGKYNPFTAERAGLDLVHAPQLVSITPELEPAE